MEIKKLGWVASKLEDVKHLRDGVLYVVCTKDYKDTEDDCTQEEAWPTFFEGIMDGVRKAFRAQVDPYYELDERDKKDIEEAWEAAPVLIKVLRFGGNVSAMNEYINEKHPINELACATLRDWTDPFMPHLGQFLAELNGVRKRFFSDEVDPLRDFTPEDEKSLLDAFNASTDTLG